MACGTSGGDTAGSATSASASATGARDGGAALPANGVPSSTDPGSTDPGPVDAGPAVILAAPTTAPTTSWVGNSLGAKPPDGSSGTLGLSMQLNVEAIAVGSDGTVYTNSQYDEAQHNSSILKNGAVVGTFAGTQAWGRFGGSAITNDDSFVYVATMQTGCDGADTNRNGNGLPDYPACGHVWLDVRRYPRAIGSDPTAANVAVPFGGGYGYDGSMLLVNSVDSNEPNVMATAAVQGLAVGGGRLFVSDPQAGQVKVFDAASFAQVGSWSVSGPGTMVYDPDGYVWVAQAGGVVQRYSPSGDAGGPVIEVGAAVGLAIDASGKLYIADSAPGADVVHVYDQIENAPVLVSTLGTAGGTYGGSAPGALGAATFCGLTGVGVDGAGNVYVSENGIGLTGNGASLPMTDFTQGRVVAFDRDGNPLWQLFATEYVNGAVVDPASDGHDLYSTFFHYSVDYDTPPGAQPPPDRTTFAPRASLGDPRAHLGDNVGNFNTGALTPLALRDVDGAKLLYLTDQLQADIFIYRLVGDSAVFVAAFSVGSPSDVVTNAPWPPNQPAGNNDVWLWRDANGDGVTDAAEYSPGDAAGGGSWAWSVDSAGNVWEATSQGIREYPLQGLDGLGNPEYTLASSVVRMVPGGFSSIGRIQYIAETDTMYVSGFVGSASSGGCWGVPGSSLARIDHFLGATILETGTTPGTDAAVGEAETSGMAAVTWIVDLPFACTGSQVFVGAWEVAGDALFSVDGRSDNGLASGLLRVFDVATGQQTVSFFPGEAVGGAANCGWTDQAYALHAFERHNGQYVVFVEEDLNGKVLMFTW